MESPMQEGACSILALPIAFSRWVASTNTNKNKKDVIVDRRTTFLPFVDMCLADMASYQACRCLSDVDQPGRARQDEEKGSYVIGGQARSCCIEARRATGTPSRPPVQQDFVGGYHGARIELGTCMHALMALSMNVDTDKTTSHGRLRPDD